jgi:hypothetical protein
MTRRHGRYEILCCLIELQGVKAHNNEHETCGPMNRDIYCSSSENQPNTDQSSFPCSHVSPWMAHSVQGLPFVNSRALLLLNIFTALQESSMGSIRVIVWQATVPVRTVQYPDYVHRLPLTLMSYDRARLLSSGYTRSSQYLNQLQNWRQLYDTQSTYTLWSQEARKPAAKGMW